MASSLTTIPSIAGGASSLWDKHFTPYVTRWAGKARKSQPLEGSAGICYSVTEDLREVWARYGGDEEAISAHLCASFVGPNPIFAESKAKFLSPAQARVLIDFYTWVSGDQPYFFLRKGRQTLGLYRKTSGYLYEPTLLPEDAQGKMTHRFTYEFIRPVLPEETARLMETIPTTVVWAHAVLPAPKEPSLEELMGRLSTIRGAVSTLTAEIDAALGRFTTAIV